MIFYWYVLIFFYIDHSNFTNIHKYTEYRYRHIILKKLYGCGVWGSLTGPWNVCILDALWCILSISWAQILQTFFTSKTNFHKKTTINNPSFFAQIWFLLICFDFLLHRPFKLYQYTQIHWVQTQAYHNEETILGVGCGARLSALKSFYILYTLWCILSISWAQILQMFFTS